MSISGGVIFTGCEVEATMDGDKGFVVVVRTAGEGGERLIGIHVPPPARRMHPQYWTAVEWGGLLMRKLYAEDCRVEAEKKKKKLPPRRKEG